MNYSQLQRWAGVSGATFALLTALACSSPTNGTTTGPDGGSGSSDTSASQKSCNHGSASGANGVDYHADFKVQYNAQDYNGSLVQVSTGGLALGGTSDAAFVIKNVASSATAAELRISSVEMTYTAPGTADDGTPAFECLVDVGDGKPVPCGSANFGLIIPPGFECASGGTDAHNQVTILARFHKPKDSVPRDAIITVNYLTDYKNHAGKATIAVEAKGGPPKILITPTKLDFASVKIGESASQSATINNVGQDDLVINSIDFALNQPKVFQLTVGDKTYKSGATATIDPPLTIKQGLGQKVSVQFTAVDAAPKVSQFVVHSNDPNTDLTAATVALTANQTVPCLLVTPYPTVDLGYVQIGTTGTKLVKLSSCGTSPVEITGLTLAGDSTDVFGLDSSSIASLGGNPVSPSNTLVIQPNDPGVSLKVNCTPPSLNLDPSGQPLPFEASLTVADNTLVQNKNLKILCRGSTDSCPTAVIDLLDGEEIIPQSQCHMSGESSTAATANGTIKSYKWTVLSQPAGAVGYGFFPNDHASKVTFGVPTNKADGTSPVQINVAGKYDFKLTVTDDKGNVSCSPAYAEVTVVPDQAIHVQLTWDTPNDTDKNDTGMDAGSDLDMHVVHPNAYLSQLCVDPPKMCGNKACACLPDLDQDGAADPWFNTPFDCYWNNPVPKWGSLNLNDDDGTLDLDDTDGWGPENFSIKSPENSTKYGVGVHYWDDHGFGDSTATAIIYVLGVAKGTFVQKMTQCDMWWVTQIDWPSGDFVDFPGAKFVAPSVGKITPKYWAGFSGGLGAPCFKGMK